MRQLPHISAVIAAVAAATVTSLVPSHSSAQVEPTPSQRKYNDRGVELMFEGDFDAAAANFQSSLALGESNIAWLNYGRALFKLQRCRESREAFDRVTEAPAVASPAPAEIAGVLERFREEWSDSCAAQLLLECAEPVTVQVDGGQAFECSDEPVPVVPGTHEVALLDRRTTDVTRVWSVDVSRGENARLAVEAAESNGAEGVQLRMPAEETVRSKDDAGTGTGRVVGFTMFGLGAAGLASALVLDRVWVAPAFRAYEASKTDVEWGERRATVQGRQQVNQGILIGAAALAASGIVIALISRPDRPSVMLRWTGPGAVAETRW